MIVRPRTTASLFVLRDSAAGEVRFPRLCIEQKLTGALGLPWKFRRIAQNPGIAYLQIPGNSEMSRRIPEVGRTPGTLQKPQNP